MKLTKRQQLEYIRMEILKVVESRIEKPIRMFKNIVENSNEPDEILSEALAMALILDVSVNHLATAADFPYKEDKSIDYLRMLMKLRTEKDELKEENYNLKLQLEKYQPRNQAINTMDF